MSGMNGVLPIQKLIWTHNRLIDRVLEKSCEKNKYRKRAIFTGNIGNGFIPVDLCVEWHD